MIGESGYRKIYLILLLETIYEKIEHLNEGSDVVAEEGKPWLFDWFRNAKSKF